MPIISGSTGGLSSVLSAGGPGDDLGAKTTTSTTRVDTGISATIAAAVGDKLLISFVGTWSNSTNSAATQNYFYLVTVTGTNFPQIVVYNCNGNINQKAAVAMHALYTVVSGDISGGNVAVKVQFATDAGTLSIQNAGGVDPTLSIVNLKH